MKRATLLIVILIMWSSCIREYETLTRFTILNESNNNLTLTVFDFQVPDMSIVDTVFIIADNMEISYYYRSDGRDAVYCCPFGIEADSAFITFIDNRKLIYRRNDSNPRNILNIDNFISKENKENVYELEYTVTEVDFNNAQ